MKKILCEAWRVCEVLWKCFIGAILLVCGIWFVAAFWAHILVVMALLIGALILLPVAVAIFGAGA